MSNILGYAVCGICSTPVLDIVAYKTKGLCPGCHRKGLAEILEPMEARGRGLRVQLPKRERTEQQREIDRRKAEKRRHDPDRRQAERLREQSKQAAFKRMRDIFPALFEVLVAQERAERGLEPWTVTAALTPGTLEATLELLADYDARCVADRADPHP